MSVTAIVISGYSDDVVLRHGISREEVAFLHKPFTADALAHLVRAVLEARRAALAPAQQRE